MTNGQEQVPAGVAGATALFGGPAEAARGLGVTSSGPKPVSGFDPNELINALIKPISSADVTRAMTPVPSGHAMQVPQQFTSPTNVRGATLDERPVVGAGNAKGQGIGNAVSSVIGALGQVVQAKAEQKKRQLASSATRLIQAQQAVDEAQLALKNNPQDKDAQEALQKNKQIREDILADDKTRKSLEKGFNISFTDPTKNKTPEHAAVQQGIADAKKEATQSYGEQFEKQMPQVMGPNMQAVQNLQYMVEQRKQITDVLKTTLPAVVRQDTAKGVALIRQATELQKQQNQLMNQQMLRKQAFEDHLRLMDAAQANRLKAMRMQSDLILARERQRDRDAEVNPDKLMKAADTSARTWASAIAQQQTQLDVAQDAFNKAAASKVDPKTLAGLKADVDTRRDELQAARDMALYFKSSYAFKLNALGMSVPKEESEEDKDGGGESDKSGSNFPETDPSASSLYDWSEQDQDSWQHIGGIS